MLKCFKRIFTTKSNTRKEVYVFNPNYPENFRLNVSDEYFSKDLHSNMSVKMLEEDKYIKNSFNILMNEGIEEWTRYTNKLSLKYENCENYKNAFKKPKDEINNLGFLSGIGGVYSQLSNLSNKIKDNKLVFKDEEDLYFEFQTARFLAQRYFDEL